MSQEPEDVKPKLNLNISYDGNRESKTISCIDFHYSAATFNSILEITVKVKTNMKFGKIFDAAEVMSSPLTLDLDTQIRFYQEKVPKGTR